jgi:lipopolysaccharide transport system ATP-binding protein
MGTSVIAVERLGKMYRIGARLSRSQSVGEALRRISTSPFRYLQSRLSRVTAEEVIWALKDVSFTLARGDILGIIGRNGAGKSTLLKILSRITDPTEGRATIKGRVNSLLEVGSGFHPELTGRENIYMNAALHGMRRREIQRKLDEIVVFSEVEKFIDTPVKRYSSGMFTRLAFAVAAHLEPDILIVDEVLAVGDAAFQRKCIGKMGEVAGAGRTVLFVSHNMAAVRNLCSRGLLLKEGRMALLGDIEEVSRAYASEANMDVATRSLEAIAERGGSGGARLLHCALFAGSETPTSEFEMHRRFRLRVTLAAPQVASDSYLCVQVYRYDNTPVLMFLSSEGGCPLQPSTAPVTLEIEIPSLPLYPSLYMIKLGISSSNHYLYDFVDPALSFQVLPGSRTNILQNNPKTGVVDLPADWKRIDAAEGDRR